MVDGSVSIYGSRRDEAIRTDYFPTVTRREHLPGAVAYPLLLNKLSK